MRTYVGKRVYGESSKTNLDFAREARETRLARRDGIGIPGRDGPRERRAERAAWQALKDAAEGRWAS